MNHEGTTTRRAKEAPACGVFVAGWFAARRSSGWRVCASAALGLALALIGPRLSPVVLAQGSAKSKIVVSESTAKAVMLYKFLNYTKWPTDARTLVLGVLGDEPLNTDFTSITNRPADNRTITIRKLEGVEEAKQCHVVFVSTSEKNDLPKILGSLKDSKVLTVSQAEGFTARGGVVRLTLDNKDAKFEISKSALKRTKLDIAPELVQVGNLVD